MDRISPLPDVQVIKRRGTITLGPRTDRDLDEKGIPVTFTMSFGTPGDGTYKAEDPDGISVNYSGLLQIDFGEVARLEIKVDQLATIHQEPMKEEQE